MALKKHDLSHLWTTETQNRETERNKSMTQSGYMVTISCFAPGGNNNSISDNNNKMHKFMSHML